MIGVVLLSAVMWLTMGQREQLTLPEKFFKDTLTWMQMVFSRPAHQVAGFFEDVQGMRTLAEENRILKKSLQQYAQLAVENEELRAENQRLKELLSYTERNAAQMLMAKVVGRNPDRWQATISIDRGEVHGVKANMPVITPQGIVGKVVSVGNFTSTVQLITDVQNGSRTSVLFQGEVRTYGVIDGYDAETGWLRATKIPLEQQPRKGQRVVTSGLGGVFPQGYLVGQVERVDMGESSLEWQAWIKPAVTLQHLEEVLIVMEEQPS